MTDWKRPTADHTKLYLFRKYLDFNQTFKENYLKFSTILIKQGIQQVGTDALGSDVTESIGQPHNSHVSVLIQIAGI